MTAAAKQKPLRMSFTDLNSARTLEAQFNPEQLRESLSVGWSELETLGGSFQQHQYKSTSNMQWQFKLLFNAYDEGGGKLVTDASVSNEKRSAGATQNRLGDILIARNYLLSMAYKPKGRQDIIGGSPSRYLFVWPNLISVSCVIHRVRLVHEQFNIEGKPMRFQADIAIKEARVEEMFSDDVFASGTFRNEVSEAAG